jgi:hypothetical protein
LNSVKNNPFDCGGLAGNVIVCLRDAEGNTRAAADVYWVSFCNAMEHSLQPVLNLFQERSVRLDFAIRLF